MRPSQRVQAFIDALAALETHGDVEPLIAVLAEDVSLQNPFFLHPQRGHDQARRFWRQYRRLFRTVRSDFHHVAEDERSALLEWTTRGRSREGAPVTYDGVTVLEFDDGSVTSFRAYFDPKRLLAQLHPGPTARAPM
jgi:steroid delta-isomerase-like uncharacterized protein